jgi:Schlafen, AlbA_2
VRRRIPTIVSSFANSLGGVLVVGVETDNGVARDPIRGFTAPNEELPLTIENICLQNINPPILPRTVVVPNEADGSMFPVVEVDESWEAPHAIENSKRVYVRTGNAGNPYELADVDLIIELVRRRAEPTRRRERLVTLALRRASTVVNDASIHVEISIVPPYPRRPLCAPDDVWTFLDATQYRGARFFPGGTLRRIEDGVASYDRATEYSQISSYGLLLTRRILQPQRIDRGPEVILVRELFNPLFKLLNCVRAFYSRVGYRGNLEIAVALKNVRLQRMPFLPDPYGFHEMDEYQCMQDEVTASQRSSTELLQNGLPDLVHDILRQVCWSFWQAGEAFPAATLQNYITETIRRM